MVVRLEMLSDCVSLDRLTGEHTNSAAIETIVEGQDVLFKLRARHDDR